MSDERFKPRGRTGEWCLSEWPECASDPVADLMFEAFSLRQTHLTPEEVYEFVNGWHPVSKATINSYLQTRTNVFRKVGENAYALTGWKQSSEHEPRRAPKGESAIGNRIIEAYEVRNTKAMLLSDLVDCVTRDYGYSEGAVYNFINSHSEFQRQRDTENPHEKLIVWNGELPDEVKEGRAATQGSRSRSK